MDDDFTEGVFCKFGGDRPVIIWPSGDNESIFFANFPDIIQTSVKHVREQKNKQNNKTIKKEKARFLFKQKLEEKCREYNVDLSEIPFSFEMIVSDDELTVQSMWEDEEMVFIALPHDRSNLYE